MRRFRDVLINVSMVIVSVAISATSIEILYRAWRNPALLLEWPNLISKDSHWSESSQPNYDPLLGFTSKPLLRSPTENTDAHGFRKMPSLAPGAIEIPPIVAVGDSFTYGMEVADEQTWPAYLQQFLGWRTINAGVNGYGLDQIVLRAGTLATQYNPKVLIVSFISDDVRRSELRRIWDIEKPYFELQEDRLVLRNSPPPTWDAKRELTFLQMNFGWSLVVERVWRAMEGVEDEPWGHRTRALPRGTGLKLACPLMQRMAAMGPPVLLVAQYDPRIWTSSREDVLEQQNVAAHVLDCGRKAGLNTLDLFDVLDDVVRSRGRNALFDPDGTHHNANGNQIVANAIVEKLKSTGLLKQ